jgi:predicted RNase H-like nuclease (RuvC/YqgF family)
VTTAVALLDLQGDILKLKSSRGFSLRSLLRFLSLECTPLMIASDVFPAPRMLEKVATAFSVPLHTPAETLSRKSKSRLVRRFDLRGVVRHKKDALAAAVNAYGALMPMMKKIERRLEHEGLSGVSLASEVAGKIILGECRNIDRAVKSLLEGNGWSVKRQA